MFPRDDIDDFQIGPMKREWFASFNSKGKLTAPVIAQLRDLSNVRGVVCSFPDRTPLPYWILLEDSRGVNGAEACRLLVEAALRRLNIPFTDLSTLRMG